MKDDLLREAIADAKAVRETAMANARVALEEAFAPKLQSMLNATLQNEADDELDGSEEGEEDFGATAPEGGEDFDVDTTTDDEFGAEGEEGTEEFNISGTVTLTPAAGDEELGEPEGDEFGAEGEEEMGGEGEEEMEELDEFSLDSIVRELEEEASLQESGDYLSTAKEGGPTKGETTAVKNVEKPGSGYAKHKTGLKYTAVKEEVEGGEEEEMEEEVNLEELIKELKSEYESSNSSNELNEVKKSLKEHRNVIVFLRSKLNEVNLLNAKLLFTNKLFKNHSMNESQKLRVIETLDRAITLKECKLIYSTLEEAFTGMKQAAPKSNSAHKIVESMASRPMGSTRPSVVTVEKSVINEGTELAARFQKLAGIKK